MDDPALSPPASLPIASLERAINRARAAEPAIGSESALSHDVAVLGALYGRLIYRGQAACDPAALSRDEREALARWGQSPG